MRVVFVVENIGTHFLLQLAVVTGVLRPDLCRGLKGGGDKEVPIGCTVGLAGPLTFLECLSPGHQIGPAGFDRIAMGKVVIEQVAVIFFLRPPLLAGPDRDAETVSLALGKGNGLATIIAGIDKGSPFGLVDDIGLSPADIGGFLNGFGILEPDGYQDCGIDQGNDSHQNP